MRTIALCAFLVLLAGCVTPTVTYQPARPVDFQRFKSVSLVVRTDDRTEYASADDGLKYGESVRDLFASLLSTKLKSLGYQLATDRATADLQVDILITTVKPGSSAARFWVGFGAGRAITEFSARFSGTDGALLAAFEGGRSYTGMEMNQSVFPSRDELATRVAVRSVEQVEEFIAHGGAFEQPARATH